MSFRPAVVPTLALIGALAVLLSLGGWQLERHVASNALYAEVDAKLYGPPATAADLTAPAEALAWRKAVLSGHFLDRAPALISGRTERGVPGYDVVAPFQVDGGPPLLVVRGWIPAEDWATHLDAIAVDGEVQLEGLLQAVEGAGVVPGGEPDPALPADGDRPRRFAIATQWWLGLMPRRMGAPLAAVHAELREQVDGLAPVYLTVGPALTRGQPKPADGLPVSGYVPEPHRIGHLEYAIQWFLIAATAVAVWAYAGWRRGQRPAT